MFAARIILYNAICEGNEGKRLVVTRQYLLSPMKIFMKFFTANKICTTVQILSIQYYSGLGKHRQVNEKAFSSYGQICKVIVSKIFSRPSTIRLKMISIVDEW